MNSAHAKQVVIVSTLIVVTASTVKALRAKEPPRPAVYLGGAIGAFGLGLIAGPAPDLAAVFAALWATSSVIARGDVLTAAADAALTRKSKPRKER